MKPQQSPSDLNATHTKAQKERDMQKAYADQISHMIGWAMVNLGNPAVFIVEALLKAAKAETQTSITAADSIATQTANIDAKPSGMKSGERISFQSTKANTEGRIDFGKQPTSTIAGIIGEETKKSIRGERIEAKDRIHFSPMDRIKALKPQGNLAKSQVAEAEQVTSEDQKAEETMVVFRNGIPFRKKKIDQSASNSPYAPKLGAA